MKILLTGKNGQVGFELCRTLAVLGEVRAVGSKDCDFRDEQAIRNLARAWQPDVIVNPAAYTAVDKAEVDQDAAEAVNTRAVAVLAEEAEQLGALLVHFSTDYVFDGEKHEPYIETDPTNPQSVYGMTKLAGEVAAQQHCSRVVILRTSWVVGAHGGNFLKTMLRLAGERDTLNVVSDQYGAPTSAALLAEITATVVERIATDKAENLFGVYHATAGGVTNWHSYACHVIERARTAGHVIRVAPNAIVPVPAVSYVTPAKRPTNSQLNTDKLRAHFGIQLPHWEEGVNAILDKIL